MPEKNDDESLNPGEIASSVVASWELGNERLEGQAYSIRDDERMRLGQLLHDSTCQLLAVVQLNLGRMRRQGLDELEATITECEEMIGQIGCQIRSICQSSPS